MTSVRMKLLSAYLRYHRKPKLSTPTAALEHLTAKKGDPAPPRRLRSHFRVTQRVIDGFDCYTVTPRATHTPKAVLYVHGGSYVNEILTPHWSFIAELAAAGCRVDVPIYGLAPTHDHHAASLFVTAVYRNLLSEFDATTVTMMGDSAGGGLALATTQKLSAAGLPQPGRLILLSPWVDITCSNPEIPRMEHQDPWLHRAALTEFARAWANGTELDAPELSPINGPLDNLPPIDIYVGTADIFYPDAMRLRDLATRAHTPTNVHVIEGGIHVYALAPVPEGKAARRHITTSLSTTDESGDQKDG